MPLAARVPAGMVVAVLAMRLVDESAGFLPAGTFEAFRADLDLSYAQAGTVLALAAPGAIAGNVFAVAADYRSRRVIAAGGAFGNAVAMAAFGLGGSFWVLAAASFLWGAAATAMIEGAELALVDLAGDDLAPMLARTNLLGAAGDLLGPAVLVATGAAGLDWRIPFLGAAAVLAAYGAWLATLPLPAPRVDEHTPSPRASLRDIARDRRVQYCAAIALLLGPLDEPFLAFLIAHLERVRGLGPSAATAVALTSVAGGLAGYAWCSRATTVTTPRSMARSSSVAAASVFAAALSPSLLFAVPAVFAFGFAIARFWVVFQARMYRLRPNQTGSVSAAISTVEFLGFGLPVLAGALADRYGLTGGLACYGTIAVAMFGLLVGGREGHTLAPGDGDPRAEPAQASS